MSPTRLLDQRILEVTSISLERQRKPQGLEVCSEGATKERHQRSFHHHGQGWEWILSDLRLVAETQHGTADPPVPPLPEEEGEVAAEPEPFDGTLEESVGWKSWAGRIASQAREDASSDGISRFATGKRVARLVHDQAEDVHQRDQPRVRDGAREEGFGTTGGSVAARRVRLRDPESVAHRNPCGHGRAHGSTSREVLPSLFPAQRRRNCC